MYVDMDDTICDFTSEYTRMREKVPGISWPQSQYGFFVNLEPIEDAVISLTVLQAHYDVWILTRPSVLNPLCYTEKRMWIENHLGLEWCHKLILCPDKSLLKGDILIDDVLWKDFEGEQILFGQGEFKTWNNVYTYLIKQQIKNEQ